MKQSEFRKKFSYNMKKLRGEMTQQQFADFLGFSRPTIGFYENGDTPAGDSRLPNAEALQTICLKCGVSADWLLGLSEVQTPSPKVRVACMCTGLSENAVDMLKDFSAKDGFNVLDSLLSSRKLGELIAALDNFQNFCYEQDNTISKAEGFLFETDEELLEEPVATIMQSFNDVQNELQNIRRSSFSRYAVFDLIDEMLDDLLEHRTIQQKANEYSEKLKDLSFSEISEKIIRWKKRMEGKQDGER